MNTGAFLKVFKRWVDAAGSQQALAENIGVSPQFLSDVLNRRREPSERLANALGYIRRITFVLDRKP